MPCQEQEYEEDDAQLGRTTSGPGQSHRR